VAGQWGTLWDHDFDDATASVVCGVLGFPGGGTRVRAPATVNITGLQEFMFDSDLRCVRSDTTLDECQYRSGILVRPVEKASVEWGGTVALHCNPGACHHWHPCVCVHCSLSRRARFGCRPGMDLL